MCYVIEEVEEMAIKVIAVRGSYERIEVKANAVITPGQLVEEMTTGNYRRHANAGQNAQRSFALTDTLQGKEIGDDYAANAQMQVGIFPRGRLVNALLADGQVTTLTSWLESNGDGDLRVHTADSAGAVEYPEAVVAKAKAVLDLSDSSGADPSSRRLLIEII